MLTFTGTIGIDQGDQVIFSDYETGGEMWEGEGPRQRRKTHVFKQPFKKPPVVHCTLSMWDMDSATNSRADVTAANITNESFDVVFRTWGNTRVARVRVHWVAIGEVENQDGWDLY